MKRNERQVVKATLACALALGLAAATTASGCGAGDELASGAGPHAGTGASVAGDGDGITERTAALGAVCATPDPSQGVSCPAGFAPSASSTTLRCSRTDQPGYDAACPPGVTYVQNDGGADSCRSTVGIVTVTGPTVPCLPGYSSTTAGRDRCVLPAVTAWAYPVGCAGTSPANGATCASGATPDTSGGTRLRCSRHIPGEAIAARCPVPGAYTVVKDGTDFCLINRPPFTVRVNAICPPGYQQTTFALDNCVSNGSDVWEPPYAI